MNRLRTLQLTGLAGLTTALCASAPAQMHAATEEPTQNRAIDRTSAPLGGVTAMRRPPAAATASTTQAPVGYPASNLGIWPTNPNCSEELGSWDVTLVKETSARIQNVTSTVGGPNDSTEKDFAWGDVNNNGWIDLVVVRKQPFTTTGKFSNILFMNEGGVLHNRTSLYASAADLGGSQGFLDETNDRDIALVDFLNNGWLDMVTAVTASDGFPKSIGHPRAYRNLANDGGGNWQGFIYENNRIPTMCSNAGLCPPQANPRFCSVAAGDLTDNGYADLYFGDYDSSGAGGVLQPANLDYDARLLINDGNGFFADESLAAHPTMGGITRMGAIRQYHNGAVQSYLWTLFGAASAIADMNNNGLNDVIKQSSLDGPRHIGIKYNTPSNPGYFYNPAQGGIGYQDAITNDPYFVTVGDLNRNGRLDFVSADDFADRYRINLSTAANGRANWSSIGILPGGNTGFRSNVIYVDLNNNCWLDMLIADVDIDIGPCATNRRTKIHRNTGNFSNMSGGNQTGFAAADSTLPISDRQGIYDIAAFDLTGNGWFDLVTGRCGSGSIPGYDVWINTPPFNLTFSFPDGHPGTLVPDEPTELDVLLNPSGGTVDAGSVKLHVSIDGGAYTEHVMTQVSGNLYRGDIPAVPCPLGVEYFVTASISGTAFQDPAFGEYSAFAFEDTAITRDEDFDAPTPPDDWDVEVDPSLTQGEWQHGNPVGVLHGFTLASPDGDSSSSGSGKAYTTCLGPSGTPAADCQVSFGPTHLVSEVIDLDGTTANISYDRWFYSSMAAFPDRATFLEVYVSNDDGNSWVFVHKTGGTNSVWETATFNVGDYVAPTSTVRVRFTVEDDNTNQSASVTNAGIDNFIVEEAVCDGGPVPPTCVGDVNDDGFVNGFDLVDLLACWGPLPHPTNPDCEFSDLDGDGFVNGFDLVDLLANWGPCP